MNSIKYKTLNGLIMRNNSFFAFLAGAVTGAVVALLFAPDSGANTQEKLKKAAADGLEAARDTAESIKERISSIRDRAEAKGEAIKDDVRDRILDKLNELERMLEKM